MVLSERRFTVAARLRRATVWPSAMPSLRPIAWWTYLCSRATAFPALPPHPHQDRARPGRWPL